MTSPEPSQSPTHDNGVGLGEAGVADGSGVCVGVSDGEKGGVTEAVAEGVGVDVAGGVTVAVGVAVDGLCGVQPGGTVGEVVPAGRVGEGVQAGSGSPLLEFRSGIVKNRVWEMHCESVAVMNK